MCALSQCINNDNWSHLHDSSVTKTICKLVSAREEISDVNQLYEYIYGFHCVLMNFHRRYFLCVLRIKKNIHYLTFTHHVIDIRKFIADNFLIKMLNSAKSCETLRENRENVKLNYIRKRSPIVDISCKCSCMHLFITSMLIILVLSAALWQVHRPFNALTRGIVATAFKCERTKGQQFYSSRQILEIHWIMA